MKIESSNISPDRLTQLKSYVYDMTNTPIGILYNFASVKDQCEKYYYDVNTKTITAF